MSDKHDSDRPLPARYPQYPEIQRHTLGPNILSDPDQEPTIELLDYWRVLVTRRWIVLAVLLTVATVTAIHTFKQVPIYRATVRIQIDRENPNILSFQDVYSIDSVTDDALQTQYEILEARSLARRVIEDLRLIDHPEFQPGEPGIVDTFVQSIVGIFAQDREPNTAADEGDELRGIIGAYLGRVTVSPVRSARLVDVSFDATDPEFAARVINAHAGHFIEQNLQFKFEATQEASIFLEGQLVTLKSNLEKAEDSLQEYSVANAILFTAEGLNTAMAKLQLIETEYATAQADRFQKEAYNRLVEAGSTNALPQLARSSMIEDFSSRLVDLQREEAELSVTFALEYPSRQRIRRQIDEIERSLERERQRVVETVQWEHVAAVEREQLLKAAVEAQLAEVNRINQEKIQYDILEREADSNTQLYNGLLTRLKEAGISAGLRASNIRIVDRAEPRGGPIRPRTTLNLLMGLAAGLVTGVGLAFTQEYLDRSIKSPDEVSRYLRLPTIAVVPKQSTLNAKGYYGSYGTPKHRAELEETTQAIELISSTSPRSIMAEAYRSMRTSILLSSPDHPPRVILVTSAVPSEGKTVTASNLAISLTQTGSRVALLDADMRKPRIHSIFGLGTTPGLSAVLTGSAHLKDVLHESSIPNLFVLPCGVIPPNPAELILSTRFQRVIMVLREYFEYVVIDSSPVSNVSDSRILARQADTTVLVVKAGSTARQVALHATNILRDSQARVAGVVMNDLDVRIKGYAYSHYSEQYSYGGPPQKAL